ncbi:MAG: nucleotide sugar dehydrogenase [Nanoarchaeota archaeon]
MKLCIVGLGYVGLPLAVAFAKHYPIIGFDIKKERVEELKQGRDRTGEVTAEELKQAQIAFSIDPTCIKEADFVIITVPTPTTPDKKPDLRPIQSASHTVGQHLKKGAVVMLESTVYPGVTEDLMAPILEEESGLKCGKDFFIGYSPERVNPGDKEHTIAKLVKIVSGMDSETLKKVAEVYGKITTIHQAPTIKTAEAAKVIENIQRDLNIALMNELSLVFNRMDIRLKDVLAAAGTKWNWHAYTPGLVGGHCIPEDPYYLAEKALQLGYNPAVILAGRFINEYMPVHVANLVEEGLLEAGKKVRGAKIGILGLTFKKNVPDYRNTKVKDLVRELQDRGMKPLLHDPLLTQEEVEKTFGLPNTPLEAFKEMDGIVYAVDHEAFKAVTLEKIKKMQKGKAVIVDLVWRFAHEKELVYKSF